MIGLLQAILDVVACVALGWALNDVWRIRKSDKAALEELRRGR